MCILLFAHWKIARKISSQNSHFSDDSRPDKMSRIKLVGGRSITAEEAIDIRQTVFGSASSPPRSEWTRTGLVFSKEGYTFGLKCPKNATRGLQSVIQAFLIKHFIFENRPKEKSIPIEKLLKPSESEQICALWSCISEIIWNIGEKKKAIVCLPCDSPQPPISHTNQYFQDNITEKLHIFEFHKLDDLQIFIKRYLFFFTDDGSPGALLVLYSAVWTRGFENVRTDMDLKKSGHLLGNHEEGSLNVITLLLSGRATPYLHNGVIYMGDEDHYALPQFGILCRSGVGLLIWDGEGSLTSRQPGSRLKTPAFPIWVTCCTGHYGVIFNSNKELLRNYHAEKRFELHHYTCGNLFISMTVDNRNQDDEDGYSSQKMPNPNSKCDFKDNDAMSVQISPLEKLIRTKWCDAKITFHHQVEQMKLML